MENLNNLAPFYSGQKLICINNKGWITAQTGDRKLNSPLFEQEVVCINCYIGHGNIWYVNLVGFSDLNVDGGKDGYACNAFKPIQEQKFPLIKLSRIVEKELVSAN